MKREDGACYKNRDLVLAMVRQNYNLRAIGLRVGTSGDRVKEFLRREGVMKDFRPVGVCDKNKEKVLALAKEGRGLSEIAQTMGTTRSILKSF